jgi:hypothetical protein
MGYIHRNCGGEVRWYPPLPIPPKCAKCKKIWNPLIIYGFKPKDMIYILPKPQLKRHEDYAKWGDRIPYVGTIASILPRWPRWARILSFIIFLIIIGSVIYWIWT